MKRVVANTYPRVLVNIQLASNCSPCLSRPHVSCVTNRCPVRACTNTALLTLRSATPDGCGLHGPERVCTPEVLFARAHCQPSNGNPRLRGPSPAGSGGEAGRAGPCSSAGPGTRPRPHGAVTPPRAEPGGRSCAPSGPAL